MPCCLTRRLPDEIRAIKKVLAPYESLTTEHSQVELLFDDERMRYMVVRVGWFGHKRIHLCLLHIDIHGDKVIIQCNNTEDLIATELVALGIPRDKNCLGFIPPALQQKVMPTSVDHLAASFMPQPTKLDFVHLI